LVFGGATTPRPFESCSLKVVPPEGAILSGGTDGEFCGATGTVGFSGAGGEICASTAETAKINVEQNKRRFMVRPFVGVQAHQRRSSLNAGSDSVFASRRRDKSIAAFPAGSRISMTDEPCCGAILALPGLSPCVTGHVGLIAGCV